MHYNYNAFFLMYRQKGKSLDLVSAGRVVFWLSHEQLIFAATSSDFDICRRPCPRKKMSQSNASVPPMPLSIILPSSALSVTWSRWQGGKGDYNSCGRKMISFEDWSKADCHYQPIMARFGTSYLNYISASQIHALTLE